VQVAGLDPQQALVRTQQLPARVLVAGRAARPSRRSRRQHRRPSVALASAGSINAVVV
jgi:hypothetical protein